MEGEVPVLLIRCWKSLRDNLPPHPPPPRHDVDTTQQPRERATGPPCRPIAQSGSRVVWWCVGDRYGRPPPPPRKSLPARGGRPTRHGSIGRSSVMVMFPCPTFVIHLCDNWDACFRVARAERADYYYYSHRDSLRL